MIVMTELLILEKERLGKIAGKREWDKGKER